MGTIRLLHLVAFAALCLFVLKTAGLLLNGGYVLSGAAPASAQTGAETAAEKDLPDESGAGDPQEQPGQADEEAETTVKTGPQSADEAGGDKPKEEGVANADPKAKDDWDILDAMASATTKSERAVLQSLANRRKKLEKRQRELEMRENLLKAADQRVELRIGELKVIEARIESELKKQDDEYLAQHMRLVKTYAAMNPKAAAEIFNKLDLTILTAVAARMKPQSMSSIMAAMEPAVARVLTLELARAVPATGRDRSKLPKIGAGGAG